MSELQRIVGIGPRIDEELTNLGISTFSDLINAGDYELSMRLSGIGIRQIQAWQRQASIFRTQDQSQRPTYLTTFIQERGRPTEAVEVEGLVFHKGKAVSISQRMKDRLDKLYAMEFSFKEE